VDGGQLQGNGRFMVLLHWQTWSNERFVDMSVDNALLELDKETNELRFVLYIGAPQMQDADLCSTRLSSISSRY